MLLKQAVATRKMCLSKDEPLTHGGDSADVSNSPTLQQGCNYNGFGNQ